MVGGAIPELRSPSIAVRYRDQKQLGEEGCLFLFTLQLTVQHEGKSGQELQAGTEAEVMEECCLLTCLLSFI